MARPKRYLVMSDLASSWTAEFAEQQQAAFAACPAAASYSDEEVEDFLMVASSYDWVDPHDRPDMGQPLRKAGIAHPPELAYDAYRLGRYIFHRWGDAAFRDLIMHRVMRLHLVGKTGVMARNFKHVLEMVVELRLSAGLATMRKLGIGDMIPAVKAAFTPEQQAQYAAQLLYGKLKLHEFITAPEPARAPTRWEQQKLLRRLHLRQVQMRSLTRSLHHLRQERTTLLNRLRALSEAVPELRHLAEQLEAVRVEQQAAENRHAEAVAAQTRQHEAAIGALQAQVKAVRADYAQALALRERLLGSHGR